MVNINELLEEKKRIMSDNTKEDYLFLQVLKEREQEKRLQEIDEPLNGKETKTLSKKMGKKTKR